MKVICILLLSASLWSSANRITAATVSRPNILWIIAEDASPDIGCYGETVIMTPNLDRFSREGIRFTSCFSTAPVCSPSRSAIIAGMYQTTFGSHNHRSCTDEDKSGGSPEYFNSYKVPDSLKLIPELFTHAGYYVVNGTLDYRPKQDYNFLPPTNLYAGDDWKGRAPGQPFFAQIHLKGGKDRSVKVEHSTDPAKVKLPPYYPDVPQLRQDWAEYLNSWVNTDREVGRILDRLDEEGLSDSTAVFFVTDHGISHLRGKQFLYDEGIHVPLLVRLPDKCSAGVVRSDLVNLFDIGPTSLELAGIPIPRYIQARPILAKDYQPRTQVFAARDRCDETVDLMRCVRTERWKYIRNFMSYVSHMQPNQYKDLKDITRTMRKLDAEGKLDRLQHRIFAPTRPVEELYDLKNDPYETNNLAGQPDTQNVLQQLRGTLYRWMEDTRDVGVIPEPILEDLGKKYGSKYAVLQVPENAGLVKGIIEIIEAGERRDVPTLKKGLVSRHASLRYWAAVWLGNSKDETAAADLVSALKDRSACVRVAAARGLCALGSTQPALTVLKQELNNSNLAVGYYAIRALEEIGEPALPLLPDIRKNIHSPYDPTERIARRLSSKLKKKL